MTRMHTDTILSEKRTKPLLILLCLMTVALVAYTLAVHFEWFELIDRVPFHNRIERRLHDALTLDSMERGKGMTAASSVPFDIVYVMGGTQQCMQIRMALAAQLYANGSARKIMLAKRYGITEYDSGVKRNLTDDEWTVRQLRALQIESAGFEHVEIKSGFFGTLSEIEAFFEICNRRGYRRIALVSSAYHTARVAATVQALNPGTGLEINVLGASQTLWLRALLEEWIKYTVYRLLVLPVHRLLN